MRKYKELMELLAEKKEILTTYERVTDGMLGDSLEAVDAILTGMQKRQELIGETDLLDAHIRQLCGLEEVRLSGIIKNRCDYAGLSDEEQELFRAGQEILGILCRIREKDQALAVCMNKIREKLQEKIRQSNTNTKFAGYLNRNDTSTGVLYDKKR